MNRTLWTRRVACTSALAFAIAGCSGTADKGAAGRDEIVAPSEYLEDIETEGNVGGVEDEADSADAQAEAAEAAAKKAEAAAAEKAKKKARPAGGW
ncbi:MAG: hypothetical protein FJ144_18590 [Deltaproteobacteria bacterium]|nr:hypothetical protein [Deltaproteobacteria bacterium]